MKSVITFLKGLTLIGSNLLLLAFFLAVFILAQVLDTILPNN